MKLAPIERTSLALSAGAVPSTSMVPFTTGRTPTGESTPGRLTVG